MQKLKGKVILVTGGGSGIGKQIAGALGAQGATVVVNDINPDRATRTVRIVEEAGGQASSYIADVAKKFPVQAMINEIEDDWGRLDAVVNNARVVPHKPLLDMDEWDWRRTVDVNLTGAFNLAQVGGRLMRATGAGALIQLVQTLDETAGTAAYQSATGGVERMIALAEEELGEAGIRVGTLHYHEGDYDSTIAAVLAFIGG